MGPCVGDVVVGAGGCVAAEGVVVGRDRARHAEGGVGVVMAGPETAAGELAERVRRLVGLLAAAEHPDPVAIAVENLLEHPDDATERDVPRRGEQFTSLPDERLCQPLAVRIAALADAARAREALADGMGDVALHRGDAVADVDALVDVAAADRTPHTRGLHRLTHRSTSPRRVARA